MSLAIRPGQLSPLDRDKAPRWEGKTGLMCLVLEAVEEVDWENKGGSFAMRDGARYQADALMKLLTYCYATGLYGSLDIEQAVHQTQGLRQLCADPQPDWRTIRRFRRLHRFGLQDCLVHVVKQALRIRFGDAETEPPLADHYVALALDRWFDPLCVPFPTIEATTRIERAVIHDELLFD